MGGVNDTLLLFDALLWLDYLLWFDGLLGIVDIGVKFPPLVSI